MGSSCSGGTTFLITCDLDFLGFVCIVSTKTRGNVVKKLKHFSDFFVYQRSTGKQLYTYIFSTYGLALPIISLVTVGVAAGFFLSAPPAAFFLDLLLIMTGSGQLSTTVIMDLLLLSPGDPFPDIGNPSFRDS